MLELLIRDLKASITVHCQQLESYSIAFAEEHTKSFFFLDVSNKVMWTADTGLAAFVFMGCAMSFLSHVNEVRKWQRGWEKAKSLSLFQTLPSDGVRTF